MLGVAPRYSEEPGVTGGSITMVIHHAPIKWHDHPSAPGWAVRLRRYLKLEGTESFHGYRSVVIVEAYLFSIIFYERFFWSYPSLHHIFPETIQTFSIRLNLYLTGKLTWPLAQVVVGEIPLHESAMCSEKIGINCSCFSVEDNSSSLRRWYFQGGSLPNIFSNKPSAGN